MYADVNGNIGTCFIFEWGISWRFKGSCITDGFYVLNPMSYVLRAGDGEGERREDGRDGVECTLSNEYLQSRKAGFPDDTRPCSKHVGGFLSAWSIGCCTKGTCTRPSAAGHG